jgi:RNA polymerase sigma factor (sigma-70 family)
MPQGVPDKEFADFVRQHRKQLWHIAKGFSLSPAWEPEDAFQEILCSLWQNWKQGDRFERSKGWMLKVAYHTLLNIKRRQNANPIVTTTRDFAGTPDAVTTQFDDSDIAFLQMVDQLSPRLREVVIARWQGFDYAEIARMLGISELSARQRHSRGINKIRLLYEKDI